MDQRKVDLWCDRVIWLGLGVFAATVNLSVSICEAGIVTAFAGLLAKYLYAKRFPDVLPYTKSVGIMWALFFCAALISALLAADKGRAFGYMPSDLFKCAGFFIFLYALGSKKIKSLSILYLAGACAAACYALYQVFWLDWPRAMATVHPVTFGEITAIALTLAVCLMLYAKERREVVCYSAAVTVLSFALLASLSRGAILGFAVSFALVLVLAEKRLRSEAFKIGAILLVLCGLFISIKPEALGRFANPLKKGVAAAPLAVSTQAAAVPVAVSTLPAALPAAMPVTAVSGQTADTATNTRFELWRTGLYIWRDNPIFGIGASNSGQVFDAYHPGALEGQHGWSNFHSLYLHHMVERGIFGLLMLLALFAALWELALSSRAKTANAYTLWAAALLPGFFVMNITETSFQHAVVAFSVLFAAGVAAAVSRE